MFKLISALVVVLFMARTPVYAVYNANLPGKVVNVLTYTENGGILFTLGNQPASHPQCTNVYFAIDATIPAEIRHQLLSRLLIAYSTGESVKMQQRGQTPLIPFNTL